MDAVLVGTSLNRALSLHALLSVSLITQVGECSRGFEAPLDLPLGRGLCLRASSMPRLAVELQVPTVYLL